MNASTWGEIDSSWIGRHVRVRWEDAGMPLAEGLPSGVPHERQGFIEALNDYPGPRAPYRLVIEGWWRLDIPAHALVQEEEPQ